MPINPQQLERQLASGTLAPVYLIAGSEDLLRLEAADAVRAAARAQGYEREVFEGGKDFDWNGLHAAFSAMSLFASRRLLDLRLPTGKPGKEGAALISAYCENPPPDLCLLISAGDWSRSHEAAWSRAVEQAGSVLVLWPLKAAELPGWIARRLKLRGIAADADAAALLAERIEGNLLAAAQEIDKLVLLVEAGERVDAARMQHLVADSARYDVFGLTDAALGGDVPRTLRILRGLRAEGEMVPGLLPWTAMQVQLLARLAAVQEAGGNLAQAMREARLSEARQAVFKRVLARSGAAHFERLVAACAAIERSGKGRGDGDPWLLFERMLTALARPATASVLLAEA
jgi:DNA polymerase III subunit delta